MKKTRLQILTLVLGMSLIGTTIASDSDTFRTGTCGASSTDGDTCVSMGINMETGEILKVTDGGKDVWGENTEVIGQFATVESVNELVSQDLDSRITELSENYENVEVNVDNSVHNTIDITDEQLAGLKGEKGDTGAAGSDGKDGITTVVNEYDKEQVDVDFVNEADYENDSVQQGYKDSNQDTLIDRNVEAMSDLNNRVDENYDMMRDGDEQLQGQVNDTNDRVTAVQNTLSEEGVLRAESDRIVAANAQKKLNRVVAEQNDINNNQNDAINDNSTRITAAEQELYSTTARSKRNEQDIQLLQQDVTRLDGMVAANMAASSITVPSDFNGNLSVGVGAGHYNGQNGL